MATRQEIIQFIIDLANSGMGVDKYFEILAH